jgi:hypothetical protein
MTPPSIPHKTSASEHACGRPLSVAELSLVLEELDRVVEELQDSLTELALPFDDESRCAACDAITLARRAG